MNLNELATNTYKDDLVLGTLISLTDIEKLEEKERKKYLFEICSNPTLVTIDLSWCKLVPTDLKTVFEGLLQREIDLNSNSVVRSSSLIYLNLSSDNIGVEDIVAFLVDLQRGAKHDKMIVYPDVRNTVIRVGFPISDILYEQLLEKAPSVFAGSLRLIY